MNKLYSLLIPCGLLAGTPVVQAESLQQAIASCQAIPGNSQRLACFDAITLPGNSASAMAAKPFKEKQEQKELKGKAAAQQAATSPVINRPAPQSSKEAEFGLEDKRPADEIEKITAVITKVTESARGKYYVYLDNDSVWQQTDSTSMRLKEGMAIYIERGTFGSFYLSTDNVNRKIKVKRIK